MTSLRSEKTFSQAAGKAPTQSGGFPDLLQKGLAPSTAGSFQDTARPTSLALVTTGACLKVLPPAFPLMISNRAVGDEERRSPRALLSLAASGHVQGPCSRVCSVCVAWKLVLSCVAQSPEDLQ